MLCLLPAVEELTSILLKCSKERNLSHVLHVHAYLRGLGLEAHTTVGNCLVFVFAESGSICHAQHVLDRLLYPDVRSWNSVIVGHVKYGDPQHALALYQLMLENVSLDPSVYTIISLLNVCTALNDLERGHELHSEIARRNLLEQNSFLGSSLVSMYAKCGSLGMAQDVFHKLVARDIYSWNSLIGVHVEHGQCKEALTFFKQMQLEGTSPDAVTFVCCLKACSSIRDLSKGFELHSEIARNGFLEGNFFVGSALVDMYAKFGALAESRDVFDNLPSQDTLSWTALMMGYVKHGHGEKALNCFMQMQHEGVAPSVVTFVCGLRACVNIGAIGKGQELHADIARAGLLEKDIHIGSTLVDMYAKCGFLVKAQGVFDELQSRNEILWNTLIAGYAEQGLGEEALWNYEQMQLEGFSPDFVTYICSLKACSSLGDVDKSQEIHAEIVKKGLESDLVVGSVLVNMYVKSNSCPSAQQVFDVLPTRSVVTWNALIAGFAEQGHNEESLNCYEEMQLDGVVPDSVTFVCCSKVCGSIEATQKGQVFHAEVCRKGLDMDLVVGSTLVDMYAKFGWFAEVKKVFDKLLIRNEVSWNALIAGYSDYGHAEEALHCFERMRHEGISADAFSLVCSLKACGSIGRRERGQEIHIEIAKKGLLERDTFVCSTLIDMYAQCGSLAEAQAVIEKLPVQNVISWNALMTGFTEQGYGEEVIKCYEQMQRKGIPPDAITLICSLKACGNIGASNMGQKIHIDIVMKGLERDVQLGSTLVDMYGKCSSLAKAEDAFDKLPVRNVVSWNVLIANHIEHRCYNQALRCFEKMEYEGISWDSATIVCVLKACASIEAIDKGRGLHAETLKKGLEKTPLVGNTLIDMYSKCGLFAEAQDMFHKLPVADSVSWNALAAGFVEQGQAEETLYLCEQIQIAGACPDAITYVCFLKACGCKQAILKGREIHAEIVGKGFLEMDVFVDTALVDMYVDCGLLLDAREVFDKLPLRNLASWNVLLAGYVKHEHGEEALNLFEQMQCEGVSSDLVTVLCIVKACGTLGDTVKGREIHALIAKKGLEREPLAGNALVDMYDKCDSVIEARKMFDRLPVRDKVSWTTLIARYSEHGNGEAALNCFEQMQKEGVPGSAVTFACCLKACGSSGALMKGQELHAEIAKKGLETEPRIGNTLVDMYSKCGLLAAMQGIFDRLLVRDVISWNALIAGYAQLGESETAFSIFDQMSEEGIDPDSVTFSSVLNACSNVGRVDKGRLYFEAIKNENWCIPTLENFTCMVDLLGRAGNLDKAISFIERMPFQPGILVWHTFLGACRKWGDVDLGQHAFKHAVQLDSNAAAAYVCMSNIYAHAGMQEDVTSVEAMRVEKSRVEKSRGEFQIYGTG